MFLRMKDPKNVGIVPAPLPKSSFSLKVAWYDRIPAKNTICRIRGGVDAHETALLKN